MLLPSRWLGAPSRLGSSVPGDDEREGEPDAKEEPVLAATCCLERSAAHGGVERATAPAAAATAPVTTIARTRTITARPWTTRSVPMTAPGAVGVRFRPAVSCTALVRAITPGPTSLRQRHGDLPQVAHCHVGGHPLDLPRAGRFQ
jgi:hypothetical protein